MPSAPPRTCSRCRRAIAKGTTCPCRPAWETSTHPSSNDRRWQKTRANQLRQHPYCQWPGCHRLATVTDHITPLAEGGHRYNPTNLQSLCHHHHTIKTTTDSQRGKAKAKAKRAQTE